MRKKHLYLQNYKKETPLFLLGKDLIKLLLGCQKLCQKNFIKPFASLPMVTEDPSNKNCVFVRQRVTLVSQRETILYTCIITLWVLMVSQRETIKREALAWSRKCFAHDNHA